MDQEKHFYKDFSFWVVSLLIAITGVVAILNFPTNIISWDTFGYYLYLPQIFIYNDLGLNDIEHLQGIVETYHNTATLYQIWFTETGNWLIRYTSGQAVLFAPFFLIAHAYTVLTGGVADGFSHPYQIALAVGCFCYFMAAVFVLRKVLRHFFSDRITAVTLTLLLLGTNLFCNSILGIASIHSQLFFLYTLLIYFTIRWHQQQTWGNIIAIAVVAGLIILTRPTDVICLLIPFLWQVSSKESLKEKYALCREKFPQILVSVFIVCGIGFVQLCYWKSYAGHWIIDSYNNPGEGMDFFAPHIVQTLFSFRKGWFIYTPLMLITLLGFIPAFRRENGRECAWACLLFVLCNIYLVSCWSCWWYAGSFSQRAYIQSYAVLALPLGFLLQWIDGKSLKIRGLSGVVLGLFCVLNLFQTWQYRHDVIDSKRMTKKAYFANFFQTQRVNCDERFYLIDRAANGEEVMDSARHYTERFLQRLLFEGAGARTDSQTVYTPALRIKYKDITRTDHAWLRIKFRIMPSDSVAHNPGFLTVTFQHHGENYKYRSFPLPNTLKVGEWNDCEVCYLTPEPRTKSDELCLYYWHQGLQPTYLQSIEVWASDIAERD
ncbi:MAG: hypothetical protein MJZ76_09810 [Bacteroidales bacterium]|nr:hypothetical protein [Bacteroidales bacterium]